MMFVIHALDKPFSDNAVHPPWLRYADNLVYLCQSVNEGRAAIQAAQDLLRPIGMELKGKDGPVDLSQRGAQATVLGISIRWDGQVQYDHLARRTDTEQYQCFTERRGMQ